MCEVVTDIRVARQRRSQRLIPSFDVTFEVMKLGDPKAKFSRTVPGIRIVQWMDPATGGWEQEVASIGLGDSEQPGQVTMTSGMLDCLLGVPDGSGLKFFLRKPFYKRFSEALKEFNCPGITDDCIVTVSAENTMAVSYDRWAIVDGALLPDVVKTH